MDVERVACLTSSSAFVVSLHASPHVIYFQCWPHTLLAFFVSTTNETPVQQLILDYFEK